jgi:mannose-6-phosphate isomerase-like protein (cupin superfamily)
MKEKNQVRNGKRRVNFVDLTILGTLYPQDFKISDQNSNQDEDGLRKSKRVKIPPLAYWKNEKIVYGRRDSGYCPVPVMKQVIRVESDSDHKPVKRRYDSKKETLTVEKAELPVINYVTQEEEDQQIVVTPDMIDPRTVGAGDYRFQKVFSEGEFLASGVLYLPRGSQKPNKNSNASAMIFVVMAGQVQVQIHKTVFTVGTGAQFFVPRGNQYHILNSGQKEARIFFCHGKEVVPFSSD